MYKYNVYWKSLKDEKKYHVGNLIFNNVAWAYFYSDEIKDAMDNGFKPFLELPDIYETYIEEEIFKTFKYRLLNKQEPQDFITDNITLQKVSYKKEYHAKN